MTDQYIPVTTMDGMYSSSTDHNHLAPPAIIPDDFGCLHDDFITAYDFDQLLELIRDDDKEEGSADPAVADAYGSRCVEQQQLLTIQDYEVDRLMMSVVEIESRRFDTDEHELVVVDAADAQPQISIDMFAACFGGGEFDNAAPVDLGGFMGGDSVPCMVDALGVGEDDDDEDDGGVDGNDSYGNTTMISTTKTTGKTDRSKRIVSERRRRGRMKDNLHALRSLVPSITKMDRASIVGDAILYVQSLQSKANRLKVELAELEASAASQGLYATEHSNFHIATSSANKRSTPPVPRYIKQMDACQVGEGEFYVKLVSNKGEEIAACLHKAIESLRDGFTLQSSNLSLVSDDYALTFTLRVKDGGEEMNLPNLKMWLSRALHGHDFILEVSPSIN
uniref:BHLH domain-containing protein n=1 Tax=Kalanchoe fedtschenkoi TaxID=63787 RepID=A0A7N0VDF6_KALFE